MMNHLSHLLVSSSLLLPLQGVCGKEKEGEAWADLCIQLHDVLGYPCEHVNISTADGFVLDVIHMPQQQQHTQQHKNKLPNNNNNSFFNYPVVVQHGLMDSAVTWFANAHPEQNLACVLHDAGYDIWLPNTRGNHYSAVNTQGLTTSDTEFWHRVDLDKIARYDLPAVIDGVLNHTAKTTDFTTLSWIGHSQGTTQVFMALSQEDLRATYAPKIDNFFAFAPVTRLKDQTNFWLHYIAELTSFEIQLLFGDKSFLEQNKWFLDILGKFCPDLDEICPYLVLFGVGDGSAKNLNQTQLPNILRYDPGGTSVRNMEHWAQLINSEKFQMYDFGSSEANEKVYGQSTPPIYDVSQINDNQPTSPTQPKHPNMILVHGGKDDFSDNQDVAWLMEQLNYSTTSSTSSSSSVVVGDLYLPDYDHMDYVWGLDAHVKVYPYVMSQLQKLLNEKQ